MTVLMCEAPGCPNVRPRRRLYCSDPCKGAAKRARRRASKPLLRLACRVCGEQITTRNPRETLCDDGGYLPDGSPTRCQALRNVAAMRKAYSNTQRCQAPGCDRRVGDVNGSPTGRPKRYCTDRCRKRAYATAKREEHR